MESSTHDSTAAPTSAGWVAIASAIVTVVTIVLLVLFFAGGGTGVLGPLNDVGNALIGVLMAALAILLSGRVTPFLRWIGVASAVVGALVAVWGSWLVISGSTGFLFAGFVSTIGYGLIAILLAYACWSPIADDWPGSLRMLGRIAAIATLIGAIAAVPGIFSAADTFDTIPPYLWLFSIAWVGVYVLMPIWSYRLGRLLTRD